MPFVITDCVISASGRVNEDRAGAAHDLAWVIDGARCPIGLRIISMPPFQRSRLHRRPVCRRCLT